jgi:hypothetical protein
LENWDGSFDAVKALTPEQTSKGFESVDFATLSAPNLEYRGDRIISIFSGNWLTRDVDGSVSPTEASWLVRGRDGKQFYSILMRDVVATSAGVQRLKLHIHALQSKEQ